MTGRPGVDRRLSGIGSHQSARRLSDEWLTPLPLLEALGPFDLDPCSPASEWSGARRCYALERDEDGLDLPWEGRVWLCPTGERCSCSCHPLPPPSAAAPDAGSSSRRASSPGGRRRSSTSASRGAGPVSESTPDDHRNGDAPTPSSVSVSEQRRLGIEPVPVAAPLDVDGPSLTTTLGRPGSPASHSIGMPPGGSGASPSGSTDAPTAAALDHSSRTTSSRSAPSTAQAPSLATSSRPVSGATDPRALADPRTGALPPSTDTSRPCSACSGCRLSDDARPYRVYLNPPYSEVGVWIRRLRDHGVGTALVFARTETGWWHQAVWGHASAILFLRGRVSFVRPDGQPSREGHNSGGPSALVAYGIEDAVALGLSGLAGAFVPGTTVARLRG